MQGHSWTTIQIFNRPWHPHVFLVSSTTQICPLKLSGYLSELGFRGKPPCLNLYEAVGHSHSTLSIWVLSAFSGVVSLQDNGPIKTWVMFSILEPCQHIFESRIWKMSSAFFIRKMSGIYNKVYTEEAENFTSVLRKGGVRCEGGRFCMQKTVESFE